MRGDKRLRLSVKLLKTHPFSSYVILFSCYFSHSVFLSTSPAPSLQHDGQSIARQSGLWCCSHLRRAKKEKKKKIFDKIWWLAQVVCFTGLLVLWVRAANQGMCMCVCVCLYSIWWCVYPRPCAVVLWCWVSPCSGLSPAARETSCETDRFVSCTHLHSFFPLNTHVLIHTHATAYT